MLALVSWVLIAPTARAWSGHSATRSVVTITAEALRKLILPAVEQCHHADVDGRGPGGASRAQRGHVSSGPGHEVGHVVGEL